MRGTTVLRSRFTKTRTKNGNTLNMPSLPDTQSVKLYRSFTEIPLENFITCFCDNDLTALIISGNPTQEELEEAWAPILESHGQKADDPEQKEVALHTRDYNRMITKCNAIQMLVKAIVFIPHKPWIEELKKLYGMPIELDPKNPGQFERGIKTILARVARWSDDAESIRKEIKASQPQGAVKADRDHFDQLMVAVGEVNKYYIDPKKVTANQFFIMVRNLRDRASAIKNPSNN